MIDRLLWADSIAGLSVGILVLALAGWLSELYGLPERLVVFVGCANVVFGSYSGSLAVRARRTRKWILFLVMANASWALFCIALSIQFADSARLLGVAALMLEALFVGILAGLEWRFRDRLTTHPNVVSGAS